MTKPSTENSSKREADAEEKSVSSTSPPSSRVRLEVAFLDADEVASTAAPLATDDERSRLTVLVVAAEPDVRRYVRECLRERADLRVLDAATVTGAVTVATSQAVDLLVVDGWENDARLALSQVRAIVIVDDVPHGTPPATTRVRLLARPFTAERLLAEVGFLLG
jgi:hypothetical protein